MMQELLLSSKPSKYETRIQELDSSLAIFHGKPEEVFKDIISKYNISKVYTNRDYEPYATERDNSIQELLSSNNIEFETFKDQVFFEKDEIVKSDGDPYVVYTPYMKLWKETFKSTELTIHYTSQHLDNFIKNSRLPNLNLKEIGFEKSNIRSSRIRCYSYPHSKL